ncbi:MAG: hypothetical protein ABEI74_04430 [Candidatus Pacearchaeota archaeon]
MKKQKIGLEFKGKNLEIEAYKLSFFGMGLGLMFSSLRKAKPLLFDLEDSRKWLIHSLFVFFPFLAVCLNSRSEVVDYKVVRPFSFSVSSGKSFSRLLEVPLKNDYKNFLENFVEKKDLNSLSSSRN